MDVKEINPVLLHIRIAWFSVLLKLNIKFRWAEDNYYKCPHCNEFPSDEALRYEGLGGYLSNGEFWIEEWEEYHLCPNCGLPFHFKNASA